MRSEGLEKRREEAPHLISLSAIAAKARLENGLGFFFSCSLFPRASLSKTDCLLPSLYFGNRQFDSEACFAFVFFSPLYYLSHAELGRPPSVCLCLCLGREGYKNINSLFFSSSSLFFSRKVKG